MKKYVETIILIHFTLYFLLLFLIALNFENIRHMYQVALCMREIAGICEVTFGLLGKYNKISSFYQISLYIILYLSEFFR